MTKIVIALMIYILVGLFTAHCVFARRRVAFLRRRREGAPDAPTEQLFKRQELEQAKALALLVGSSWPVSAPLLVARRIVAVTVVGRCGAGGKAERVAATRERIAALEHDLGLDDPAPGQRREFGRRAQDTVRAFPRSR